MIDAYTIGVTLALEDGVSAGLAAIRAELVDVLSVTERTTAALAALRAMAGEVTGIAPPPALRTRPVRPEADAGAVREIAAPAVPAAPDAGAVTQATRGRIEVLRERTVPAAPGGAAPGGAPPGEPPRPAATPAVAPVVAAAAMAPLAERDAPDGAAGPAAPATASRAAVGPRAVSRAVAAPVAPPPAAAPEADETDRTAPASPMRVDAVFIQTQTAAPVAREPRMAMEPRPRGTGPGRGSAAPRARVETVPATRLPQAEQFSERPARREARGEASGDVSGDVPREATIHLDGAVLGAWIEEYLTHRLSGPRHAGTGFDARMTPAWPGMAME